MSGYIGNTPALNATQVRQTFTATAGQTSFATAGYQVGYLDTFLNGIKLNVADVTATNGSDVVVAACAAGDILDVILYGTFDIANMGGAAFNGDVGVTGTVTADGLTVQNVNDTTTNTAEFRNDNGNRTFRFAQNTSGDADLLLEKNDGTDAVLISTHGDSYFNGGNVGIGGAPSSLLHLEDDTPIITLRDTSAYSAGTGPYIRFQGNDSGSTARTFGEIYGLSNGSNSGDLAFYTRNSGSTAERMRINSTGAVTMPSQPYFAVEIDGNGNYTNTASTVALPFNTAVHNIGNHFNTSTYRFTAPITGKYLMAVGVIHNQANPTGRLMFYLNGNSDGGYIKWGINGSNTAGGGSHTATSIIYMSAGDYVDVRSHSGIINNYQDNHSSWTGMLLG